MESAKLIPIAVDIYTNGHIFILAAPSKEAFMLSFEKHHPTLAFQLCEGAESVNDNFTRLHQAAFIGGIYSELRK